jgi:septum site-determining protein MinD
VEVWILRILAVSSGKGGTGKSCVAAYIGLALARTGKRILLMELAAGPRSLDLILGFESALFHIRDVADGRCDLASAMASSTLHAGLSLIPAPPDPLAPPITGVEFERAIKDVPGDIDYVILDGVDFSVIPASIPDCVIMVVTPDSLAVRAGAALSEKLRDMNARELRLVINNVPTEVLPMREFQDFDDIIDSVGARLLAVVPASRKLAYAAGNAEPVAEDSLLPKIFGNIAARLAGEERPLLVK